MPDAIGHRHPESERDAEFAPLTPHPRQDGEIEREYLPRHRRVIGCGAFCGMRCIL